MEEYKVRRFVNDKEVRELTQEQKKMMAVTVIRAIGAKEKKTARRDSGQEGQAIHIEIQEVENERRILI